MVFLLDRLRKGFLTREDIEFINTRVVGSNLSFPSYEELNGDDITYACSTNAERNLITDKNFGNILKTHHPKMANHFLFHYNNYNKRKFWRTQDRKTKIFQIPQNDI